MPACFAGAWSLLGAGRRRLGQRSGPAVAMQASGRYSIAPMLAVTDLNFRTLARLISRHSTLYTEMIVDQAVIHGSDVWADRSLRMTAEGQLPGGPLVLQLGGSDPDVMEAACSKVAKRGGFTEVNLNCGCPSERVAGAGCFGAVLMREPDRVAALCSRMHEQTNLPVSVKCRIGLDNNDNYDDLADFVEEVSHRGGVRHFIIHARTAILKGLSPKQNREIPPLKYGHVYRLKEDFPDITFTINGGINSLDAVEGHLARGVDGVMVGRAVRDKTWQALADVDEVIYGDSSTRTTRREVLQQYAIYAERERIEHGQSIYSLSKPALNMFFGDSRNKLFKKELVDGLVDNMNFPAAMDRAMSFLDDEILDRTQAMAPQPLATSGSETP